MFKQFSKFGNVKLHGLYSTFGPLRYVWPTLFILNVFTALKGIHFYICNQQDDSHGKIEKNCRKIIDHAFKLFIL